VAVGYTTFTRPERANGPEARRASAELEAACESRGMELKKVVGDAEPEGRGEAGRPGLDHVMRLLAEGEADCLIVSSLARLSDSAGALGLLIDRLRDFGVRLVVTDIDLDTSREEGALAARTLVTVGELERRRKEPPAPGSREELRSVPEPGPQEPRGVPEGSASAPEAAVSPRAARADKATVKRRIAEMRARGMTLQAIADSLNAEGVPTLRGGTEWRPSSVQAAAGYKRPHRKPKPDPRKPAPGPGEGAEKARDG
jgi:DNA invertase Pin-like site-specific DNA recombinase